LAPFSWPAPTTSSDDANSPLEMQKKRYLARTATHMWCTPSGSLTPTMSALKQRLFLQYRLDQDKQSSSTQGARSRQWTTSSQQMRLRTSRLAKPTQVQYTFFSPRFRAIPGWSAAHFKLCTKEEIEQKGQKALKRRNLSDQKLK
jgi:hypothetical protein